MKVPSTHPVRTHLNTLREIAIYCPDSNLPIGLDLPKTLPMRGGKAAIVQLASAFASLGIRTTIFTANPIPFTSALLSVKPISEARGFFDAVIFTSGATRHFNQSEISHIEGRLNVLAIRGPAPVESPPVPIDLIVVPSQYIGELATRLWGFPTELTYLIRGEAVRKRLSRYTILNAERDPFLGIYASTPEKGLNEIINALERLKRKGFSLRLEVYGTESFSSDFPVKEFPDWVSFKAGVPHDQMQSIFLRGGFMPYFVSWADGCSLATAEAMSAGTIAFVSGHGSNAEFVAHGQTGFLVPVVSGRPDFAAAEAMLEEYLRRPSEYLPMRLAAARSVPTWPEIANQWINLLTTALEVNSHKPHTRVISILQGSNGVEGQPNQEFYHRAIHSKKHSALLVGDFGVGNTGDNAILLAWSHLLCSRESVLDWTVVAPKNEGLPLKAPAFISLHDWQRVEEAINANDLVILAGGGLFHDWWALEPEKLLTPEAEGPTLYLSVVAAAARAGKPTLVFGIGIGPIRAPRNSRFILEVLKKASAITTRDQNSYQFLLNLENADAPNVFLTADMAFDLPSQRPPSEVLWAQLGLQAPPRPRICVALRGWDVTSLDSGFLARIGQALTHLVSDSGGSVLFLPFQAGQGHPWTDDVAVGLALKPYLPNRSFVLLPPLTPQMADSIIAEVDLVLAMRFHAAVFAFRNLCPVLGLAYDPKVEHLFADAFLNYWCWPLTGWSERDLASELARLLAEPNLQHEKQLAYVYRAKQRLALHPRILDTVLALDSSHEPLRGQPDALSHQLRGQELSTLP
jgi:polysaccharide pyruvyl transferase CsaB